MGRFRGHAAPAAGAVGTLFLAAGLVGCGFSPTRSDTSSSAVAPNVVPAATMPLVVEPDAGIDPIDALLAAPQHQLDLVMYELADPTAVGILVADEARGVNVRVMLDYNRERAANAAAYEALGAGGVHVVWAPKAFEATHEKAFVIDPGSSHAEAVIMTLNLTSRYYADTRDVAVVDRHPADVRAIEATFAADEGATVTHTWSAPEASAAPDLVWSPGATAAVVDVIASATRTLDVENEEMSDTAVVDALIAAAHRGVTVTVVLTAGNIDSWRLAALAAGGVDVRLLPDRSPVPYIHAKVVVADDVRAFVGSENFSTASLNRNRELGVVLADPTTVTRLAAMIAGDANERGGN